MGYPVPVPAGALPVVVTVTPGLGATAGSTRPGWAVGSSSGSTGCLMRTARTTGVNPGRRNPPVLRRPGPRPGVRHPGLWRLVMALGAGLSRDRSGWPLLPPLPHPQQGHPWGVAAVLRRFRAGATPGSAPVLQPRRSTLPLLGTLPPPNHCRRLAGPLLRRRAPPMAGRPQRCRRGRRAARPIRTPGRMRPASAFPVGGVRPPSDRPIHWPGRRRRQLGRLRRVVGGHCPVPAGAVEALRPP
jgi:hypothetical protein